MTKAQGLSLTAFTAARTLRNAAFIAVVSLGVSVGASAQYQQYPNNRNNGPYNNNGQNNNGYNAPNAIPEGTRFIATLEDKLDTKKISPGKKFKMKLAEDLTAPNGQVIPRGKKIKGHVSSVERGFRGRILLSFDEIETKHGWVPLIATVTGVPGEHGVTPATGNEGEIERRGTDKRRAIEAAGVGAAVGAIAGAVAGGGKGAAPLSTGSAAGSSTISLAGSAPGTGGAALATVWAYQVRSPEATRRGQGCRRPERGARLLARNLAHEAFA